MFFYNKKEIEQLTSKNANLNDSLAEIAEFAAKINFTIQDTMTGSLPESLVLAIKSNLLDLIHKIGNLCGYDIDTRAEEDVCFIILNSVKNTI
jgi:hypothetical protein